MSSQELKGKPEYRAVTLVGGTSLTIVLPRHFSEALEVERGDYVKIVQDGKRLIVEKAS
jgi:antitoxin component of MazEF toxin-antitoxin module